MKPQYLHENLTKPNIQQKLAELQANVAKRNEVTVDMIIEELKELGFSNIADFMYDGKMLPLAEVEKDRLKAVSQVKLTRTKNDDSERETIEFKFYDKLSALDKLARHLGFYEKDHKQQGVFNFESFSNDELDTMLNLVQRASNNNR